MGDALSNGRPLPYEVSTMISCLFAGIQNYLQIGHFIYEHVISVRRCSSGLLHTSGVSNAPVSCFLSAGSIRLQPFPVRETRPPNSRRKLLSWGYVGSR